MDREGNLVVSNLTKRFGNVTAVDDISFKVVKGEVLTLLGPSGCGKTTTLSCIAGIEKPDKGRIAVGDRIYVDVERGVYLPPEKREIGIVFQSYALWPHMTVFDNIAFPLKLRKYAKEEIRRRVKEVLELVGLEGMEKRYPYQLSGGQQQRVALARAIVYEPQLLLLDEPLSNLDAKIRDSARFWLRDFQQKIRTTVVYVTHDQAEAMVLSDVIAVMNEGKILQIGKPKEIYENPANKFVADFIGGANLLPATVSEVLENNYYLCMLDSENIIYGRSARRFNKGDRCFVVFRPFNVKIAEHAVEKVENVLEGIIHKKAYLGGMYDYRILLRLEEERIIRIVSSSDVGVEGAKVSLNIPKENVLLIQYD